MLAEVRKYGESLIIVDQIPNKLTPEVLKNTNTKIVHRLFASDDKDAIGNTMALTEEQKEFLSSLETGRVIVSNQDFSKPIQVQIEELKNISTTNSDIVDNQTIRKNALAYYQDNYKKGIIIGLELLDNTPTITKIEKILNFNFYRFLNSWEKLCKVGNGTEFTIDLNWDLNLEIIKNLLIKNFYYNSNNLEWIENNLLNFLKNIVKNGKKEFSREESSYLRLRS